MTKRERNQKTGERLKKLRESRGVMQNFIADKLGISKSFLSDLEAGNRNWSPLLVRKYENLIDV